MPDTQRTLSDLLSSLFQDGQADSAITPQDMRDLIVTAVKSPFGGIYTNVAAETTIASAGVYVKVAGTTQANVLDSQFDTPTDNRLRYTGVVPIQARVTISISFVAVAANKLIAFKLYKFDDSASSGVVIDASITQQFIQIATEEQSITLSWDVQLDNQDYLELHVANITDTVNLTVNNMYLFAHGIVL